MRCRLSPTADVPSHTDRGGYVPQADVRRVNAALAFLVRKRPQTAPQDMKTYFLRCSDLRDPSKTG